MKSKYLPVLLILAAYSFSSCDDPKKANNYNQETTVDQNSLNFINSALDGGRTEVKLSNAAEGISHNQRIISFAKMMVHDHTQVIEGLKRLRKQELINPDDALSAKHKKLIDSISSLSGDNFDKAYISQMVADHQEAVSLFKNITQDREASVQVFARKVLPTIQMHYDSAKAIAASIK